MIPSEKSLGYNNATIETSNGNLYTNSVHNSNKNDGKNSNTHSTNSKSNLNNMNISNTNSAVGKKIPKFENNNVEVNSNIKGPNYLNNINNKNIQQTSSPAYNKNVNTSGNSNSNCINFKYNAIYNKNKISGIGNNNSIKTPNKKIIIVFSMLYYTCIIPMLQNVYSTCCTASNPPHKSFSQFFNS